MAKIFCALYSGIKNAKDYCALPPFYESLLFGLRNAGNEVLCFFHKNWGKDFSGTIPEDIKKEMLDFDADIYILFNNHFWDISELTDKPIIIYEVDSPLYYKNLNLVKEKKERFLFFTIQQGSMDVIYNTFGVSTDKVCYIPPFTEIKADSSIEQDTNISFVGTNWGSDGCRFINDFIKKDVSSEELQLAKASYMAFSQNPFMNSEECYYAENEAIKNKFLPSTYPNSAMRISGLRRLHHLEAISDLGLDLRGVGWIDPSIAYFPGVAFSYNKEPVFTLEDNQNLYNRSKIGFNINHIQAKTGFSWRVCEIMASNACLVAEYKQDMLSAFPGVKLPMYNSPYEARELCKKLLDSDEERQEIVSASHEIIESRYRFSNALHVMEEFLDISLSSEKKGTIRYIFEEENTSLKQVVNNVQKIKKEELKPDLLRKIYRFCFKRK